MIRTQSSAAMTVVDRLPGPRPVYLVIPDLARAVHVSGNERVDDLASRPDITAGLHLQLGMPEML